MELKDYNPNSRCGTHTVLVSLMQWGYTAELTYRLAGNMRGADILADAAERIASKLYEEQGEYPKLIMSKPAENGDGVDTLECECYGDDEDSADIGEWITPMIVGARIVSFEPEKPSVRWSQEVNQHSGHAA